jgi:hypothetical protein
VLCALSWLTQTVSLRTRRRAYAASRRRSARRVRRLGGRFGGPDSGHRLCGRHRGQRWGDYYEIPRFAREIVHMPCSGQMSRTVHMCGTATYAKTRKHPLNFVVFVVTWTLATCEHRKPRTLIVGSMIRRCRRGEVSLPCLPVGSAGWVVADLTRMRTYYPSVSRVGAYQRVTVG